MNRYNGTFPATFVESGLQWLAKKKRKNFVLDKIALCFSDDDDLYII